MALDKERVKALKAKLDAAVKAVAAEFDLEYVPGRATYAPDRYSTRLELRGSVDGVSRDQRDFEMLAPLFGLRPEHFGREFTQHGITYRLVGLRPRASKSPLIMQAQDGKRYTFTERVLEKMGIVPVSPLCEGMEDGCGDD